MRYQPGIVVLLCVTLLSCGSDKNEQSETRKGEAVDWESVPPGKIAKSPVRHDSLTENQMVRIKHIQEVFREVYPLSTEEWIDGFRRDVEPEGEIVLWEELARAYSLFLKEYNLSMSQKHEVYAVLMKRSMMEPERVLDELTLNYISEEQAMRAMELYRMAPVPPTVIKTR
jgi:hypothetical protein